MENSTYTERAVKLLAIIDIGISAIERFPPPGFDDNQVKIFTDSYRLYRSKIENPEKTFMTIKSLKISEDRVLIYFMEAHGEAVDYFWNEVKAQNVGFNRINKLRKVLKKKRLKSEIDYNFIIDVIGPYQEEGLINGDEIQKLNNLLVEFEKRANK